MENKNEIALNTLRSLKSTFESNAQGAQAQADALQVAIDVISNLYVADVEWRESEVAKEKEAVAAEIKEKEEIIARLTEENTEVVN